MSIPYCSSPLTYIRRSFESRGDFSVILIKPEHRIVLTRHVPLVHLDLTFAVLIEWDVFPRFDRYRDNGALSA
jgi:hypothetical protein